MTWSRVPANETMTKLGEQFQGSDAHLMALKQMMGIVRTQAEVLSFADVFLMLTVLFVALAIAGVAMKRPVPVAAGARGH